MDNQPTQDDSGTNRRRRGAPQGNQNAVKHGYYAKVFKQTESVDLSETNSSQLTDEIQMLRVFMRRVIEKAGEEASLAETMFVLRSLSQASACLNRLIRTQAVNNSSEEENHYKKLFFAIHQRTTEVRENDPFFEDYLDESSELREKYNKKLKEYWLTHGKPAVFTRPDGEFRHPDDFSEYM
ncbi:MAG: hypothetical protein CVU39_26535 [Chloroflexi bacterium HGW-Chloroflexi-10]|nr:MAG: hypothetical protein CVU39_26535 [Chloroflexi bacterium HGW-Chloroflexi-10]